MLYTVANEGWSQGRPLAPTSARGGLRRSRAEAGAFLAGGPTLAVALRYDGTRGMVVAEGIAARGRNGPWSAPAVVDALGGVTVLTPIPAALVRVIGRPEVRTHPGALRVAPRPHVGAGPPEGLEAPGSGAARPGGHSGRDPPAA